MHPWHPLHFVVILLHSRCNLGSPHTYTSLRKELFKCGSCLGRPRRSCRSNQYRLNVWRLSKISIIHPVIQGVRLSFLFLMGEVVSDVWCVIVEGAGVPFSGWLTCSWSRARSFRSRENNHALVTGNHVLCHRTQSTDYLSTSTFAAGTWIALRRNPA